MAEREALPERRAAETINFRLDGIDYVASGGFYPDGRLGEIFLRSVRVNSTIDIAVSDAAIVASIALQYRVPLDVIKHALKRNPDGTPASALGRAFAAFAAGNGAAAAQEAAE